MDTVNMANQMVNFQGKEISLDDFMIMYDNFKNMMGKVSKKFLEPIEVKGDKNITLKINPDHENDYVGALEFVRNMLIAKGEQQPLRLLFQAWMVAKEDFCYYLKELILHSSIGDDKNIALSNIVMPFDGVDQMFEYKDNKINILLNKDLIRLKNPISLISIADYKGDEKGYKEYDKDNDLLISVYGDLGKDKMKKWIYFYKCQREIEDTRFICKDELILQYRLADLGEWLYEYSQTKEAC